LILTAFPAMAAAETELDTPLRTDQEIGARLGTQLGAFGVTPGGLRVGGVFLYRLSERTWFDAEAASSFGAGASQCSVRQGERLDCEHGLADGFGFQLGGHLRWFLSARPSGFQPYVRGGLGVDVAHFGGDDVTGVALTGRASFGVRYPVASGVRVGGEALVSAGPGFYGNGVGIEPYAALLVQFGVEISLGQ
jgi:hypothetical protein